ncbi:uncharacterized protein M421DRAFT_358366 [Didymella exigua CBS 183.55]|uniref:Uncharacterized protein n=1 Tax=Didymella exigua CBS 183.55 TaxID=1150837 RepID=A0A6A5RZT1_9PLEO|nr:uncharacterized protein M421DRAFT_358366 [Didymella exigua CBS 183.55]KAF1930767.1 hypothetical protein M421DRAFT_358366 [Didymella exigua CBS 183.55]
MQIDRLIRGNPSRYRTLPEGPHMTFWAWGIVLMVTCGPTAKTAGCGCATADAPGGPEASAPLPFSAAFRFKRVNKGRRSLPETSQSSEDKAQVKLFSEYDIVRESHDLPSPFRWVNRALLRDLRMDPIEAASG